MSINIQNVTKSYGGQEILENFSLEIPSGVRLCVCGPNGCGKSTLLRLLAGEDALDNGRVTFPKGSRVGYVQQELDEAILDTVLIDWVLAVLPDWNNFWEEWEAATQAGDKEALQHLGVRQAELEQIHGYNPEHRAKAVLSGLGFSPQKWQLPIRQLSGGWRERAKLARVLTAGADILLLDEPTNHLDLEAVEWLEGFLLDYRGALVFVAHDRIFMDRIGTHVLYLGGRKPLYRAGSFTKFLELHEEIETQKGQEASRLQEEIERKMAFVKRFKAKASKARQAGSKQKVVKKLEKELDGIQFDTKRKALDFKWPAPARADKTVCSVVDLAFSFTDGKHMWPALSFQLYRGMKIALAGPNGCGKSTLLKLIDGRLEKNSGTILMGGNVRMGFFSQHQLETLRGDGTVLSEIRRLSDPRTTEEELMSVLGQFMLGQKYFDRIVHTLSGGEKSRLILATLFLARCNFLVLDEPTNHLDLESREALIDALSSFEGTILMVAHDRYLLARVAEQVWALSEKGITVYDQGFSQYDRARKNSVISMAAEEAPVSRGGGLSREEQKRVKREQAEKRNAIYKELKPKQEAYTAMESELETLLEQQGEVEQSLADPDIYNNSGKAQELLKNFHELQARSEALMEKMGEMETVLAELERQKAELTIE